MKTTIYVFLTKVCESTFQVSWKQYCRLMVQYLITDKGIVHVRIGTEQLLYSTLSRSQKQKQINWEETNTRCIEIYLEMFPLAQSLQLLYHSQL